MSRPQPVHGTPIHSIGDVASMAMRADAAAAAAQSPGMSGGLTGISEGSGNPTLDLPFLHNRQTFQICSCWRRKETNVFGGKMTGCYWVCDAIPVNHVRQWNWSGSGNVPPPDTFWQADKLGKNDLKTRIWCVTGPPPCCNPDDSGDGICDSSEQNSSGCDQTDWEAAVYPKFGLGQ